MDISDFQTKLKDHTKKYIIGVFGDEYSLFELDAADLSAATGYAHDLVDNMKYNEEQCFQQAGNMIAILWYTITANMNPGHRVYATCGMMAGVNEQATKTWNDPKNQIIVFGLFKNGGEEVVSVQPVPNDLLKLLNQTDDIDELISNLYGCLIKREDIFGFTPVSSEELIARGKQLLIGNTPKEK